MKKLRSYPTLLTVIIGTALFAIVSFQVYTVFTNYAGQWLSRAWRTRSLTSMERNVLFLYGNNGAEFMEFISQNVPFDSPIVLPNGYDVFSTQSLLQFFLFPRAIVGCDCPAFLHDEISTEACTACLLDPDRVIPSLGSFPPEHPIADKKDFIPFPSSDWYHGIYVPISTSVTNPEPFVHMEMPLIQAFLIDLGIMLLLFLTGASISYSIDSQLRWKDLIVLGIPVGAGSSTFSIFIFSLVGISITFSLYLIVMVVLLAGTTTFRLITHRNIFPSLPAFSPIEFLKAKRSSILFVVIFAGFAIFFGMSIVISVARGYSLYDGIANWALKGYAIAETGSVTAGSRWGGHVLSYPQNIHLLIAMFRLADGDVFPGSKMLFPSFCISLLLGCYIFLQRHGVNRILSLLGAALILSTPEIFVHSTLGWGNLIFTAYLILGVFFAVYALTSKRTSTFWISGLLIGFAVWTRPEGIGYAVSLGVLLLGTIVFWRGPRRAFLAWAAPIAVIAAIWGYFSLSWIANDEIGIVTNSFLASILNGNFRLDILVYLIRYGVSRFTLIQFWGVVFVVGVILLIGGMLRLIKQIPLHVTVIIGAAAISFLIPLFMFYVAGFDKTDLQIFLDVSFDRALFTGVIFLIVGSLTAVAGSTGRE